MPEVSSTDKTALTYRLKTCSTEPIDNCFRQRQTDVFASLANLEAAHAEVTKATKDERKTVKKASWRRAVSVPEDLVTEKEQRAQKSLPMTTSPKEPEFRKPTIPKPRATRRPIARDPAKWTRYSLADVDEDGGVSTGSGTDSNFSIASSFINELRARRGEDEPDVDQVICDVTHTKQEHRILFRPTRGIKRSRKSEEPKPADPSLPHLLAPDNLISPDESSSDSMVVEDGTTQSSTIFVSRKQKRQIRSRPSEDIESSTDSIEGIMSTSEENTTLPVAERVHWNADDDDVDNDELVDHLA